jgi:DNA polymerase-1
LTKAHGGPVHRAEDLKLYRSIATMDKKAPLPKIAAQTPSWHKAAALARKWQLTQLAGRLEEMARARLSRERR